MVAHLGEWINGGIRVDKGDERCVGSLGCVWLTMAFSFWMDMMDIKEEQI